VMACHNVQAGMLADLCKQHDLLLGPMEAVLYYCFYYYIAVAIHQQLALFWRAYMHYCIHAYLASFIYCSPARHLFRV
jgi:hypothetical protein